MDENRNQAQPQNTRNKTQPQGNKPQDAKRQWDGHDCRTGAERRHRDLDLDLDMQMHEGSSR